MERNRASGVMRAPEWDAVENWTSQLDLPQLLEKIGIDERRVHYFGQNNFSVIDPLGRRYEVVTPRPLFYLVKRGAGPGGLEQGLQNQAISMGIPIEYGTACPPGGADIWAVGCSGQATGFISLGFTFHTSYPDWICCLIDKNIAPRAYAYLVIRQGEGTMAVVLSKAKREAHRLLDRALTAYKRHADFVIQDALTSGGSGGDAAAFWHSGSALVIGEAAGFQDFLWGFGIRHALASGFLAAQTILTNQAWQAVAEQEIRPLVRASLVNRWMYNRMPNMGYALLIRKFARDPDLAGLLRRWYFPRRIHRVLWPMVEHSYLKRLAAANSERRYPMAK
jgi:hypothetical protein